MKRYAIRYLPRFFTPKAADIEHEPDAEDYLAHTVFEESDPIDTGLLDKQGNRIFAINTIDQIGFVREGAYR